MRALWNFMRRLWAGIAIGILVPVLVCRILGVVAGGMLRRRRTRTTFYRSLRRAGLNEREAIQLTERYHARLRLRELLACRLHHAS